MATDLKIVNPTAATQTVNGASVSAGASAVVGAVSDANVAGWLAAGCAVSKDGEAAAAKVLNRGLLATPQGDDGSSGAIRHGASLVRASAQESTEGTASNDAADPGLSRHPDAPTNVVGVAGALQAVVSFDAPADTGSGPITEYRAISTPGGVTKTGTASPLTVTGLSAATAYTFTVRATNAYGNSVESAASAADTTDP